MNSVEEIIVDQYLREKRSPYEIAEYLREQKISGYYPIKIRRLLIKLGVPLRDKSSAQTSALQSGRSPHPTKGKHLKDSTKGKISTSVAEKYALTSDEEKQRRACVSKENWDKITPEKRQEMQAAATEAILFSAKNGSKVERFLYNMLTKSGFEVVMHARPLEYQPKLQCDLLVKNIHNGVVIEVDGLSHVEPIWGAEAFARTKASDAEKNAGITTGGLYLIRLHAYGHKITQSYCNKLLSLLLVELDKIKQEPMKPLAERLIHIKGA
jgi:hypothetical protein